MATKKSGKTVTKFFRNTVAELKKVAWPNRREVSTYTIFVLATVVVVALTIFVFDSILGLLITRAIKL
ncbi:MAG: preprotein translocase subunit SecE [Firmicutes bacterium]|nr:preprotein translocase subunit SecE [Bacillota bacterium]